MQPTGSRTAVRHAPPTRESIAIYEMVRALRVIMHRAHESEPVQLGRVAIAALATAERYIVLPETD